MLARLQARLQLAQVQGNGVAVAKPLHHPGIHRVLIDLTEQRLKDMLDAKHLLPLDGGDLMLQGHGLQAANVQKLGLEGVARLGRPVELLFGDEDLFIAQGPGGALPA